MDQNAEIRRYFSVIVGAGCNAACPFCISPDLMKNAAGELHQEVVDRALQVADRFGCEVASVSGGGEPLLLARKAPEQWERMIDAISTFPKRDLHSNFSFHPKTGLDVFTHLTVSLWRDREITSAYLGRDFHDRVVDRLMDRPSHLELRLSAVAGSDWLKGPEDLVEYTRFAKGLGASQVTIRELQPSSEGDTAWMAERYMSLDVITGMLSEVGDLARVTENGSNVFDVEGLEVCPYRYADDGEDLDFVYLRPDRAGAYGAFLDFDNDQVRP